MVGVKVCGIKTDLKNQEANDFSNGWFVFYFLHYYNYFLYFSHYINCLITCFLFLLFLFRYLLYTLLYKENVNINTICHLFSCCDVQVNPSCTCNKMENTVCMKDFTEWQGQSENNIKLQILYGENGKKIFSFLQWVTSASESVILCLSVQVCAQL